MIMISRYDYDYNYYYNFMFIFLFYISILYILFNFLQNIYFSSFSLFHQQ